jgi:hypothetical protein
VASWESSKPSRTAGEAVLAWVARVDRWAGAISRASACPPAARNGDLSWFVAVETSRSPGNCLLQELWRVFRRATSGNLRQQLRTRFCD